MNGAQLLNLLLARGLLGLGEPVLLPALFVAVVVEDHCGHATLGIALKGEAGDARSVGIKEAPWAIRRQFRRFRRTRFFS